MSQFQFSKKAAAEPFQSQSFFEVYKDADFLKTKENVEEILCKSYELREFLRKLPSGEHTPVGDMKITKDIPLLIKNTSGANIPAGGFEFTYKRLCGLTAAYALENRLFFPNLSISEANVLGLEWDVKHVTLCQLYLSAIYGSELFDQFSFYPLLCAFKRFQIKKINIKSLLVVANTKNSKGKSLIAKLSENMNLSEELWKLFKVANDVTFNKFLITMPTEVKVLLK